MPGTAAWPGSAAARPPCVWGPKGAFEKFATATVLRVLFLSVLFLSERCVCLFLFVSFLCDPFFSSAGGFWCDPLKWFEVFLVVRPSAGFLKGAVLRTRVPRRVVCPARPAAGDCGGGLPALAPRGGGPSVAHGDLAAAPGPSSGDTFSGAEWFGGLAPCTFHRLPGRFLQSLEP